MKKLRILLVPVLLGALTGVASANLLLNESFETGTGQDSYLDPALVTIDNWTFGTAGGWWSADAGAVNDGAWAVKRWTGGSFIYQDFTASEGQAFDFAVWGYDGSGEALVDRRLDLKVEWLDSGLGDLGATTLDQLFDGGPLDTWTELSGSASAPANTAYGRIVVATEDEVGAPGGSVYFDSASVDVAAIPEPTAAALLGIGLVGLLRYRRKMRG